MPNNKEIPIGINLMIKESKNELSTVISKLIEKGLPVTVLELHLYSLLQEVHALSEQIVEQERQEFNQAKQKQLDEQKDKFVQE